MTRNGQSASASSRARQFLRSPYTRVVYFWMQKKVHWSDSDAAGIVWFPNFFSWFEDAEEELYTVVLGRSRQSLLDALAFGMPRVEVRAKYVSPLRPGDTVHIGIRSTLENPRRLRHDFEMRNTQGGLVAEGFVRVACVDLAKFTPRDLPAEVLEMVNALPAAAEKQGADLPWV